MRPVSIEEIVDFPLPGQGGPTQFGFAPDRTHVVYLDDPEGGLNRRLFALNLETGGRRPVFQPPAVDEAELPLEEKLRRERLRERGTGVTRVIWSPQGGHFLVPIAGTLWAQGGLEGQARPLIERAQDPTFSADGRQVAFVRDGEVWVVPFAGGTARQLTTGEAGRARGLAEYIAQEEMSRMRGYWWSPDGRQIAFVEVDDAHIPAYRILHQGAEVLQWEDHAYPFAGATNARVRLGVVDVDDGAIRWMPLSIAAETDDLYLARVRWTDDGTLWAEVQDRRQQRLDLVRYDVDRAEATVVLTETSAVWINLHHLFHGLQDGGFLWGSERSGFMHLYRYDREGVLLAALTAGDWMVDHLVAVDERRGLLYILGTHDDAREQHLYAVALSGTGPLTRLTPAGGFHTVTISARQGRFIDEWSRLDAPPTVVLRDLATGAALQTLYTAAATDARVEGLAPPELVEIMTPEGVTLYGALFRPDGPGPSPTVVSVYGGPHAQRVQAGWHLTVDMRAQYLRGQGFAVLKLDNRGSARRGLAFEGAIHGNMGDLEIQDQVTGVRWLIAQGIADPDRVGIYGWSYGGYLSLMALARAPETFRAAAAGAPVTHWDTYDTHYTERYMGLPAENPEGYQVSSVMAHIENLRGNLLLIHGLIDENVLFRHSARLINALNRQRIRYDLLLFPDERHMPRARADRLYLEDRLCDFFRSTLRT